MDILKEELLDGDVVIYNGDCLDVLPNIETGSVDSIICDPPYYLGLTHNGVKGAFSDLVLCKPFFIRLFKEYKRVLKKDGCVYFFCDWRSYAFYFPLFNDILGATNMLVWHKNGRPQVQSYGYSHELLLFRGKLKNPRREDYFSSVINLTKSFADGATQIDGAKVHPTQKPVRLIKKFILDSTHKGDLVLDAFFGSGTTGVACIETGRRCIGVELQDTYYEISKTRCDRAVKERREILFEDSEGLQKPIDYMFIESDVE